MQYVVVDDANCAHFALCHSLHVHISFPPPLLSTPHFSFLLSRLFSDDAQALSRPVEVKNTDSPEHKPIPLSRGGRGAKKVTLTGTGDERGFGLDSQYKRLRREAMEQARKRNKAYQQAAEA